MTTIDPLAARHQAIMTAANDRFVRVRHLERNRLSPDVVRHAQVSELWIPPESLPHHQVDVLGVLLAHYPADQRHTESCTVALIALEHLVTGRTRSGPRGLHVTSVPLGRLPHDDRAPALVFAAYLLPRGRFATQIIDDCRRLLPAIDYDTDLLGSQLVAESVLTRLDALTAFPGFRTLLLVSSDPVDGVADSLAAITDTSNRIVDGAYDGRLRGPDGMELATAGLPSSFALVEFGDEPTVREYIAVLEHAGRGRVRPAGSGSGIDAVSGEQTETYRERDRRLRKRRDLAFRFGPLAFERELFAPALSIAVGSDLWDAFTEAGQLKKELTDSLNLLRDGLMYESGYRVPEVHVRRAPDLGERMYSIEIWSTRIVTDSLRLDRLLVNDTVERLRLLNVVAEDAVNPANGNESAWVSPDLKEILETAGLTTWDAQGYLILHASAIARNNYAMYFTVDSAAAMIQRASADLYRRVREAPGGISQLTTVIRLLLAEDAPIKVLKPLVEQYLQLVTAGHRVDDIVEELRCGDAVRPHFKVAKSGTPVWELGPQFLEAITDGIHDVGKDRVLALEPELCQEMLAAVRYEVGIVSPTIRNAVMVVDQPSLRPHLRRLVELEFPHLAVVARRELHEPGGKLAEIELE